ncbi:hypothetical protein ACM66B_004428 [Microbotryomycetes sp. NB124-2]
MSRRDERALNSSSALTQPAPRAQSPPPRFVSPPKRNRQLSKTSTTSSKDSVIELREQVQAAMILTKTDTSTTKKGLLDKVLLAKAASSSSHVEGFKMDKSGKRSMNGDEWMSERSDKRKKSGVTCLVRDNEGQDKLGLSGPSQAVRRAGRIVDANKCPPKTNLRLPSLSSMIPELRFWTGGSIPVESSSVEPQHLTYPAAAVFTESSTSHEAQAGGVNGQTILRPYEQWYQNDITYTNPEEHPDCPACQHLASMNRPSSSTPSTLDVASLRNSINTLLSKHTLLPLNWLNVLSELVQEGEMTLEGQRRGESKVAEWCKLGRVIEQNKRS